MNFMIYDWPCADYRAGEFVLGWNRGTVMVGVGAIISAMALGRAVE